VLPSSAYSPPDNITSPITQNWCQLRHVPEGMQTDCLMNENRTCAD
jgi:hypothetical protein